MVNVQRDRFICILLFHRFGPNARPPFISNQIHNADIINALIEWPRYLFSIKLHLASDAHFKAMAS